MMEMPKLWSFFRWMPGGHWHEPFVIGYGLYAGQWYQIVQFWLTRETFALWCHPIAAVAVDDRIMAEHQAIMEV